MHWILIYASITGTVSPSSFVNSFDLDLANKIKQMHKKDLHYCSASCSYRDLTAMYLLQLGGFQASNIEHWLYTKQ